MPYELNVAYGPAGEKRVHTVQKGNLWLAGPLGEGWRTVTTNAAVFGRLGDRLAIDGAGQDLWKTTAEFGSAYKEGALAVGTSVTVRVDSQAVTGPWARAGLIARDSLAEAGSPASSTSPPPRPTASCCPTTRTATAPWTPTAASPASPSRCCCA
ncbi:hypothetical protein NKH77_15025 [Streptomyces sp. M19]